MINRLSEAETDHMEIAARVQADELFGEFVKDWFGERSVPGMDLIQNQQPQAGENAQAG